MTGTSLTNTQQSALGSLVLLVLWAIKLAWSLQPPPFPERAPPRLGGGFPLLGHIEALTAPWKLFQRSTNSLRTGNFSFTLGSHRAISLSSSAGRDTFFTHPKLAFGQGYDVLFSPHESRPVTQYAQDEHDFLSTIKSMTTTERLSDGLQIMMSDINTTFNELGPAGTTRPFDSLYELVFQLTTCAFACREIGADPVVRKKALKHLKDFINNETPTAVLLPNLPSLPKARKALGALGLHSTMRRIITERKKSGRAKKDCIQPFIEMGKPDVQITTHLVSILDAGVISTGAIAPWILCQLGIDPDWMAKVRAEIAQLGAKYATNDDREASLAKQLLSVPLKAWETELPLMDLCVKETIRLHFQLPMMLRRNISGEDIEIPGDKEVIPKDAIVFFYPPAIMEDATVYSNPGVWDPSRFLVTRSEDKNKFGPHTFIGWGSGRHPCRGMRFAKLEMNLIAAFFLARFRYEVVDGCGRMLHKPLRETPRSFQNLYTKPDILVRYESL